MLNYKVCFDLKCLFAILTVSKPGVRTLLDRKDIFAALPVYVCFMAHMTYG